MNCNDQKPAIETGSVRVSRPTTSDDWIKTMLQSKLDGNAVKLLLAYMDKGAWREGKPSFLSRKDYEAYGFTRPTVSRQRKELQELGWLVPTGKKSEQGYEYFLVEVGQIDDTTGKGSRGGASKRGRGCINLIQGVPQIDTGGASTFSREVIEEVMEEVIQEVTTTTSALGGEAPAGAVTSELSLNKNIKEDQEQNSLNLSITSSPAGALNEVTEPRGVHQFDTPYWKRKGARFDAEGNEVA